MIEHGLIDACLSAQTCLILAESDHGRSISELLEREGTQCGLAYYHWHPARGVTRNTGRRRLSTGLADPMHFLINAEDIIVDAVFVFEAVAPILQDPTFASALHAFAQNLAQSPSCVVCIDAGFPSLPVALENLVTRCFPDRRRAIWEPYLKSWRQLAKGQPVVTMSLRAGEHRLLNQALNGPTTGGVFRANARQPGSWRELSHALAPKATSIDQTDAIEFFRIDKFPPRPSESAAIEHLLRRCTALHSQSPRKIVIAADPGSGRSLMPFLVGRTLGHAVLRLNIADLLEQHEAHEWRRLLHNIANLAKSFEPLVVWLQDCQELLTYLPAMQVCLSAFSQLEVTMVATVDASTSERWSDACISMMDHTITLTKPSLSQRHEIFASHLRTRHLRCDDATLALLASASHGLTGGEIEDLIIATLRACLDNERGFAATQLLAHCEALAAINSDDDSPAARLRGRGWVTPEGNQWDLAPVAVFQKRRRERW